VKIECLLLWEETKRDHLVEMSYKDCIMRLLNALYRESAISSSAIERNKLP
jgi:hypothetical protein